MNIYHRDTTNMYMYIIHII